MNQKILHRYIAGEATQEEKEDVARWLDSDKKNMKEFLAQRKLYDISIWQQESPLANRRRTLRYITIEFSKIAAIFIIAFSVSLYLLQYADHTNNNTSRRTAHIKRSRDGKIHFSAFILTIQHQQTCTRSA